MRGRTTIRYCTGKRHGEIGQQKQLDAILGSSGRICTRGNLELILPCSWLAEEAKGQTAKRRILSNVLDALP